MTVEVGAVVVSLSGHDKGRVMAVIAIENGFALICDGRKRRLEKPKRKKLCHLSVLSSQCEGLAADAELTNRRLWAALTPYRMQIDSDGNKLI